MKIKVVTSHDQMVGEIGKEEKAFVLLYRKGSEISECAYKNIADAMKDTKELHLIAADVSKVNFFMVMEF